MIMRSLKNLGLIVLTLVSTTLLFSCSDDDKEVTPVLTPSEILASTAWETTGAKNNKGENVVLTDANVAGAVGYAYYDIKGTFVIYDLKDVFRIQGDWSVSADGKTRTLVAKNPETQAVLFTRVVDILVLTTKEFTYRLYPNSTDRTVYYDIIHKPTTHAKPGK
ncbi:hypothetical protein HMPREF0765_0615 [Sphingobacterium spiritivorum ATCC 33300]|uniref:DUF4822 domain-containing protein n=2 Tax=Sphingobacterium spiritivorum TaxID=258 RepID=C2FTF9_SPHSI|nr:hypothetical protein HMPREF0765_0615 [Sphingobacterium spiritivorum ATCC 33300]QQS98187.1 DUF4822 domain-containing protein [Sphingobacterium spiritivorum]